MAKNFSALASEVAVDWTAEAHALYAAAANAFTAELDARERIGATLSRLRKEQGKTQLAVSREAGIQQAELSRIENGLGNPTVETLLKILAALDSRLVIEPA